MGRYSRELSVAAVLGVLLVALAIFAPNFFAPQPLLSRLASQMPALVAAIGMTCGLKISVAWLRPSSALSTEIAGVMMPSP